MMKLKEKDLKTTIAISSDMARNLKFLAEVYKKPCNVLIEELIEKEIEKLRQKRKKEALKWIKANRKYFKGIAHDKSFQELKAEKGNEI